MSSNTRKILKEDISKSDVDRQIASYINTAAFKDKIEKIVQDRLKKEDGLEGKVVEITTNVLTQLFKTLYNKRGIWKNNLSNKSS